MEKQYVPLHLHTEFSLLDGAIRLKEAVKFSKEQGWPACAITDHGNVFGGVKFFKEAKKAGIKPILGCEAYFTPDATIKPGRDERKYYHATLLVQNNIGYQNLCRLMEFAYTDGFYFKPRIDLASLEKYNEGLIVTSGCQGGYIPQLFLDEKEQEAHKAIEWFMRVFGPERFYLEVMPADTQERGQLNDIFFKTAEKYGITVIATPDSHYLKPEHNDAHEIMLAIGTKASINDPKRMTFGDFKGHLKTTQEMLDAFPGHEEAVWNTKKVADLCNFEYEFGKLLFPKSDIPEGKTEESYFRQLCKEGLDRIFDANLVTADQRAIYDARLKIELDLIVTMGFIGYFLVVGDFIAWSKKEGIPVGPGRGSVAGSLIAWALQITNVDPIKYNLLFERFLNPERVSMPDIDIDFCIERRENVINYVRDKYGHDSVCQIITFGTMLAKGVIKDVGRVLDFPFQDTQSLSDLIPDQLGITLSQAFEQEPKFQELMDENPRIKHLLDVCLILEGLTRHASKHAAGVVIAPEPLKDVVPLYIPSKSTDLVTQYAMTELESLGFLKMDFLGLKNLTIIDRTVNSIKKRHNITIDLDRLALDDDATFQTLCDGKTSGVFQFEGDGVTKVIQKLQPSKFEDLIAVNALYRPGPLGSGMVDDFIDRRHGRKKVTYMFPELEPVLTETYGVIVYQEQVMKISSAIAGFSLGSADILRRAMGKKKVDVMAEQKVLFIEGAQKLNFNTKKAGELFDLMAYFAGYGFNKSHSTAYALIAYQTAYLKTHYPKEFSAAILSLETKDPAKLSFYLHKVKEQGIDILPPDVNESSIEFTAVDEGVRFGLQGIKNVGNIAILDILEQRKKAPFVDIFQFCKRINQRCVNKRVMESLIYAGALDSLPGTRAQKVNELEEIMGRAQEEQEAEKHGQVGLFQAVQRKTTPDNVQASYQFKSQASWPDKQRLEKEKEVVGFYLSAHPLDAFSKLASWLQLSSICGLKEFKEGSEVAVLGAFSTVKAITTKRGDRMAFVQMEDAVNTCEVIVFPSVFKKVQVVMGQHEMFIVRGTLDKTEQGACKIKADTLIPAEQFFEQKNLDCSLLLEFPKDGIDTKLSEKVSTLPAGKSKLQIIFFENETRIRLTSKQTYRYDMETLNTLESHGCQLQLTLPERPKRQKSNYNGHRQYGNYN